MIVILMQSAHLVLLLSKLSGVVTTRTNSIEGKSLCPVSESTVLSLCSKIDLKYSAKSY